MPFPIRLGKLRQLPARPTREPYGIHRHHACLGAPHQARCHDLVVCTRAPADALVRQGDGRTGARLRAQPDRPHSRLHSGAWLPRRRHPAAGPDLADGAAAAAPGPGRIPSPGRAVDGRAGRQAAQPGRRRGDRAGLAGRRADAVAVGRHGAGLSSGRSSCSLAWAVAGGPVPAGTGGRVSEARGSCFFPSPGDLPARPRAARSRTVSGRSGRPAPRPAGRPGAPLP